MSNPFDPDARFFAEHPTRQCHIRVARDGEAAADFQALGPHEARRRRILAWKVPRGQLAAGEIVRLSFLAFGDETIEDDDATLLPLMHDMALKAGEAYGMAAPRLPGALARRGRR